MFIEIEILNLEGETVTILINTLAISYIEKNYVYFNDGKMFELTQESLKQIKLAVAKKSKKIKNNDPDKKLQQLFNELHELTGGTGKVVFSLSREKQLKALLDQERFDEDSLRKAAKNIGEDAWLQGENPNNKRYGDVDFLLREDKASKFSSDQFKKKKGMF